MSRPEPAAQRYDLLPGIVALPSGLLWLEASRSLVAADAHLAHEEAIGGGVLPAWSTLDATGLLLDTIESTAAQELILLGDVVHSTQHGDVASKSAGEALDVLRRRCTVTTIAGNGEATERGGWTLFHAHEPSSRGTRNIVGHLHPSVALARGANVPAFLWSPDLIVVPALTPYSRGSNVLSHEFARTLHALAVSASDVRVAAAAGDCVFPFGSLDNLRSAMSSPYDGERRRLAASLKRR